MSLKPRMWRQPIAKGVSPWDTEPTNTLAPYGATDLKQEG